MRAALALAAGLCLAGASGLRGQQVVYRIVVSGTIENGLAPYVTRSLREAERAGAAAAFLDIDTPGGRIDAAERIADAVRAAKLPVYAFVNPRAYSAGALISLATDGIYMRPGAVLGAATPVSGAGEKAPEKYVSAMRAEFRALADEQGLDPKIAEAMVDENATVPGLTKPGQLLTLSTSEAVRVRFARGEVADQGALLVAIGAAGATVVTTSVNWAEALVRFLTNPVISPLLLSLGILGLIVEIKHGAFGLGGLLSVLSISLFFGSSLILGLAGWEEVILLGLGAIALGVEIFLIPGFGVTGVIGLLLIGAATVLAMVGSRPDAHDLTQAFAVLGASLIISFIVIATWIRHLPSSGRFSGLLLQHATPSAHGFIAAPERGDLVGQEGIATTDLRPAGTMVVGEERLDVVTEGEYIHAGSRVRIVRSEGYRHIVRRSS